MLLNYINYEVVKQGVNLQFSFRFDAKTSALFKTKFMNLSKYVKDSKINTYDSELPCLRIAEETEDYIGYSFNGVVQYKTITLATIDTLRGIQARITDSDKEKTDEAHWDLYNCVSVLLLYIVSKKQR